jgi:putative addiction module component (TIGR02574 family)
MSPEVERIYQAALRLPPRERAALVEQLLQSFDAAPEVTAEFEAAWIAEAHDRMAAFERDEITARDGESVFADAIAQAQLDELVRLAQHLQVSRSQLLAQALTEYLARRRNHEMLAQINEAYADGPDETDQAVLGQAMQQQRRLLTADE